MVNVNLNIFVIVNFWLALYALLPIPPLDGGKIFERTLQIDTVSGKLATSYTPQDKIKEVVFEEHHCILH